MHGFLSKTTYSSLLGFQMPSVYVFHCRAVSIMPENNLIAYYAFWNCSNFVPIMLDFMLLHNQFMLLLIHSLI